MVTARRSFRVALFALFASVLEGQTVRASLVDRDTGRPVASAMISLRDSTDQSLDVALSDRRGQVRLTARFPGRYSLAIQRIGAPEERSPAFDLDSAAVLSYEHRLGAVTPVDTARLRARASSRMVFRRADRPSDRVAVVAQSPEGAALPDVQLVVADDSGTVRTARVTDVRGRTTVPTTELGTAGVITLRRLGWQPAAVRTDSVVSLMADTIVVTLAPAPPVLTAVSIRAGHPLQRFYGLNPRSITGRVLWPDQVEALSPSSQLPDILRAAGMASLIAYPVGSFGEYCYAIRFRLGGPICMPIYFDGMRADRSIVIDYTMVHSVAILRPIDATILFGMDAADGAILVFSTAVWGDRTPARR
jgi:hypothetical protein